MLWRRKEELSFLWKLRANAIKLLLWYLFTFCGNKLVCLLTEDNSGLA